MKKLIIYAFTLLVSSFGISCSQQEGLTDGEGGTGVLKMNISATRAEQDGSYNPLEHIVVNIYNEDGGLLRRYTSMDNIPERLELIQGRYRVVVEAGRLVPVSSTERLYKGEKWFNVVAGELTTVEVVCKIVNTVVEVKFDQTVTTNFGEDFYAWVAAADQLDEQQAEQGLVPALKFTDNGVGYFNLPEGVTTLAWKFSGQHPSRGPIVKTGVQTDVKGGGKYVLTFRFSKDLPGYIDCVLILVDTSTDDEDDTIIFSPDPAIAGEGFDMEQAQDYIPGKTADKSYRITTMTTMRGVTLTLGAQTYDLMNGSVEGITVVKQSSTTLLATLTDAFLATLPAGEQTLLFHITDTNNGELQSQSPYRIQGLIPAKSTDHNLWSNSLKLRALILDADITSVTFGLRKTDGAWQEIAGAKGSDNYWSATLAPQWEASANENGLTVYSPAAGTGVFANGSYEYRATTIDATLGGGTFTTATGDVIQNAGMEDWATYKVTGSSITGGNVAYPNANSSTVFWVGSNNGATSSLCTGQTIEGNNGARCAQLHPQIATGNNFAAGSLFTGKIDFGTGLLDMFGFARFGIQYQFSARPKALRVHYKAVITKVTHTGKSHLTTNDNDPARIFVAITDWTGRHAVKSGVSFDANTFWDPVKTTSLSEGPILGYGSKMITASTDGWVTEELPIVWYDTQAAPGANNYSLSISSATSAYGDYMGGSQNNYLYIEDFEWVY